MSILLDVLLVTALMVVLACVTIALVIRHVVRRLRRTLHRPAVGGLSRMHRDLSRDITATSQSLRTARRAGRPVEGLQSSVAALVEEAQELQVDRKIIATEPDRRKRARMISAYSARVNLIHQSCAQVRAAVLEEGTASRESRLDRVVDEINEATMATRLRVRAYRELSQP